MTSPRNARAYLEGRVHREAIKAAWLRLLARNPFATPTAKAVRREAGVRLSERAIRWHLERLRIEAAEDCQSGNSSAETLVA